MSHFSFEERPISRASSGQEPEITLNYVATGTQDEQYVHSFALAATPSVYSTIYGLLFRQDVQIEPAGFNVWYVAVPFAKNKRDIGSFHLNFDTTGGTAVIKAAKAKGKVYTAAGAADNDKRVIGVNGDNVEGAEITIPSLKLTARFTHPAAVITIPKIKQLANITGMVNEKEFLEFDPGETLFLGCSGSEGTDAKTEVSYHFACSSNLQNEIIAGITVLEKDGWDFLWFEFADDTEDAEPVKKIKKIHVDKVYYRTDLGLALGFGG